MKTTENKVINFEVALEGSDAYLENEDADYPRILASVSETNGDVRLISIEIIEQVSRANYRINIINPHTVEDLISLLKEVKDYLEGK